MKLQIWAVLLFVLSYVSIIETSFLFVAPQFCSLCNLFRISSRAPGNRAKNYIADDGSSFCFSILNENRLATEVTRNTDIWSPFHGWDAKTIHSCSQALAIAHSGSARCCLMITRTWDMMVWLSLRTVTRMLVCNSWWLDGQVGTILSPMFCSCTANGIILCYIGTLLLLLFTNRQDHFGKEGKREDSRCTKCLCLDVPVWVPPILSPIQRQRSNFGPGSPAIQPRLANPKGTYHLEMVEKNHQW